jgi:hypothetical protein
MRRETFIQTPLASVFFLKQTLVVSCSACRYYNPDNWKKQAKNYFGDHKAKMLLCAHPARTVLGGLTKLVSPTSAVR